MRIAVLTHYFPTSRDPWAGHSAYQTLRLIARQHPVHVFYPESVYPAALTPPSRRAQAPVLDRTWQPGEVDVTYIPFPALPIVSRPLNGFVIAHRLLPAIRRWQPDILLNYIVYPSGYAAVRVAHALRIPVVLTAIGSDLNRIPDPLCRLLTRSALRQADMVTTVSQDLCRTAQHLGAPVSRSRAILNGCDTAVFHPASRAEARHALALDPLTLDPLTLDPEAEIVLYVGRLDLRKGLLELIDAIATLAPTRPRLRCFLVGDGSDEPALRAAIARHNLGHIISLIPPCRTAQVAQWMAAADLVTLPSYKEGCPNVVLEALAAGRPVVASNVGGIPELMDETCGRLIPTHDVPALAAALQSTLSQTWDAQAISTRHSRSWANVAADLNQVLSQLSQTEASGGPG